MPKLEENLQIAKDVIDEIKTISTCSNDIIKKELLPFLLPTHLASYVETFGKDKVSRYLEHIALTGKLREISTSIAMQQGCISPLMVGKVATVMHGVGECHELSIMTGLKLLERFVECVILAYVGNVNTDRQGMAAFNHVIVLMGNININYLSGLSRFKHQPDDVVVLDAYLGYAGSARNYVKDNKSYIDKFGLESSVGNLTRLGANEFKSASIIKAQAQKVSEQFLKDGIQRYQRHKDDEVSKLISVEEKDSIPCNISTYPALLFDLGNSQQQSKDMSASIASKVEASKDIVSTGLFSFVSTPCVSQFFSQGLASYHFSDDEVPCFSPAAASSSHK